MTASRQASKRFGSLSAGERITQLVEGWSVSEPLFFAAWTMHNVVANSTLKTIRVGQGQIEFNPDFITALNRDDLKAVLTFEAMRILLGHPYSRQQTDPQLSYQASNLTVQECLRTRLPMPRPRDLFGDESYDHQYLEFYYRELDQRRRDEPAPSSSDAEKDHADSPEGPPPPADENLSPEQDGEDEHGRSESDPQSETLEAPADPTPPSSGNGGDGGNAETTSRSGDDSPTESAPPDHALPDTAAGRYCDPVEVGSENTAPWRDDELRRDEIMSAVREASESDGWGTVGGAAKEQLIATLRPPLDYRRVLSSFRHSVLSVRRRLTRMKPSRRYGFAQMGSRYDFTTRLLFAVDVSGSMGSKDLEMGFSIVREFFRYGVESIDVLWFDEEIQGQVTSLKKARRSYEIRGRGGTNFQPVVDYIDQHRDYDGLIIFTDGYAPVPTRPSNRRTRILWLFKDEPTHLKMQKGLRGLGRSAFLHRRREN